MRFHHLLLALALAAGAETLVPATNAPAPRYDWVPGPFQKYAQPIFTPSRQGLDDKNVYNMAVVKEGDRYRMVYRGESTKDTPQTNTGRLFLAESDDGIHWKREPKPIMVPEHAYESRGVEDPRLIRVDGTYYLTYTGYDGKLATLCLATSRDLEHWTKHGPMFPQFREGNDVSPVGWTKSGAILDRRLESGPYAGKYVAYFGESDMWFGWSDDLLHWEYRPEPVLKRRPGMGDSRVCEPGPPPLLTRSGILLLYAGDRVEQKPYVTYAALFSGEAPDMLLKRTDRPVLEPTLEWEIKGYIPQVTFAESLIREGDRWRLYYGGADHVIGLAEAPFDPALFK